MDFEIWIGKDKLKNVQGSTRAELQVKKIEVKCEIDAMVAEVKFMGRKLMSKVILKQAKALFNNNKIMIEWLILISVQSLIETTVQQGIN